MFPQPELVEVAKQCYAVVAKHKQSQVVGVDRSKAFEIIAENEQEMEQEQKGE
jgi:hypothetical protein